jgi:hypothetical protein
MNQRRNLAQVPLAIYRSEEECRLNEIKSEQFIARRLSWCLDLVLVVRAVVVPSRIFASEYFRVADSTRNVRRGFESAYYGKDYHDEQDEAEATRVVAPIRRYTAAWGARR